MSEIYARISDKFMLRGWSDCPLALVEKERAHQFFNCKEYEYVIKACDGLSDFSSPAFLPKHRYQLGELIDAGFVVLCKKGDTLSEYQRYIYTPCPVLKEINWAITDACNLHCVHCFMNSPNKKEDVKLDTVQRIISEIINAHVPVVTLTGGEPLLSPYFKLIVSELSNANVSISHISTNAVLLNEDIMDFLLENNQHPDFLISYDGAGVHDLIRGQKGLESIVLENTSKVLKKGFTAVMVTTLMQQNMGTLRKTYDVLKELSPSGWFINRAQSTGLYQKEKRLSTEEIANETLPLYKCRIDDNKPFPMVIENFCQGKNIKKYTSDSPECFGNSCGLFLLPDGTLMPCQGFVGTKIQEKMPNILKEGLIKAWENPSLEEFRHAVKKDRLEKNPDCKKCPSFSECGMGCRAYALSQTGSMDNVDSDMCDLFSQGWRMKFNEYEK